MLNNIHAENYAKTKMIIEQEFHLIAQMNGLLSYEKSENSLFNKLKFEIADKVLQS